MTTAIGLGLIIFGVWVLSIVLGCMAARAGGESPDEIERME